jgi:hypothetical protein
MWEEVRRLTPWADLRTYDAGAAVLTREPGDVVVIYSERAPDEMRRRGVLGKAKADRRLVFVFLGDLERLLRLPRGTHAFQVALGRVVAHELEHVRRGAGGHDERGWFVACLGREDLLSPWFGR